MAPRCLANTLLQAFSYVIFIISIQSRTCGKSPSTYSLHSPLVATFRSPPWLILFLPVTLGLYTHYSAVIMYHLTTTYIP